MGRRAGPRMRSHAAPLIRTKLKDLAQAGVIRVPRTRGVRDGLPLLDDGQVLQVSNVVWCTGYERGFSWIDLPVFDERGMPMHRRGVAVAVPGLSFVGLQFLYAMSSSMIHGVERDANYIAERIVSASSSGTATRSRPQGSSTHPASTPASSDWELTA